MSDKIVPSIQPYLDILAGAADSLAKDAVADDKLVRHGTSPPFPAPAGHGSQVPSVHAEGQQHDGRSTGGRQSAAAGR